MFIFKIKNSFFFNILSFSGYFALIIFLLFYFIWTPEALIYNSENLDPDITYTSLLISMGYYSEIHLITSAVLLVLGILESRSLIPNILPKFLKFHKFKSLEQLHNYFFWMGIFLVPLPIYCYIFIYLFVK